MTDREDQMKNVPYQKDKLKIKPLNLAVRAAQISSVFFSSLGQYLLNFKVYARALFIRILFLGKTDCIFDTFIGEINH
jgi:hypothetical protein